MPRTTPSQPVATDRITLAISDVAVAPDGSTRIVFQIDTRRSRPVPAGGYALWSEDPSGDLALHDTTLAGGTMHQIPFGRFRWNANVTIADGRRKKFFVALERANPERASNYVEVAVPAVPPVTELSAQDAVLKVRVTGRARSQGHPFVEVPVKVTIGDASAMAYADREGRWSATLPATAGTHTVTATALGISLGDAAPVSIRVVVGPPPAVPLLILFPEEHRPITRLTRVTGTGVPMSDFHVRLGKGPVVTTTSNAGGAWEARDVQADKHGEVAIVVESAATGEIIERDVRVDYFPAWAVETLACGPTVSPEEPETPFGVAIADGSGEFARVIEYRAPGTEPWHPLGTVEESGRWAFLQHIPPAPPFRPMAPLELRCEGDPVVRTMRVEPPPPIILVPESGAVTGATPEISGVSATPLLVQLDDETEIPVRPEKGRWKVTLGPLEPGEHTVTARHPPSTRGTNRVTFLVDGTA